jgi:hypothetical protein
MGTLMDLIAGETNEILLAVAVDDWAGLRDRGRFPAHLALGAGLDPTWLDFFSEAIRAVTGSSDPEDFLTACTELDGPTDIGDRTVERIDRAWLAAVARISDHQVDGVAARWIDLLDEEFGELMPREEKPWIRRLAAEVVGFARAAEDAPDVLFAWSL